MSRLSIIRCVLSFLLLGYLIFALVYTQNQASGATCSEMKIIVNDLEDKKFVTETELSHEIQDMPATIAGKRISDINTDEIEKTLNAIDKVEMSSCVVYSDGEIIIKVEPMVPVARIFEDTLSYYINRQGKKMMADKRYHMDVPIISGKFSDSTFTAKSLLPIIQYINENKTWSSLISMVCANSRNEIILVPMIRGHVINFGDTANIVNKFCRLRQIYKDVIPLKGWEYYDTISLKWESQVVATRRQKKVPQPSIPLIDDSHIDADSPETMSSDVVEKDPQN